MSGEMIPHDRRSTTRLDASHLVLHANVGEADFNRALGLSVTLDISEFGVKVQATEPLNVGDCYRFSIALGNEIVAVTGKVVHVTQVLNGTYEHGVEFLEISARDIEKIRKRMLATH
jgi:c-di-GMP-binding flagellar brake protein YcgR